MKIWRVEDANGFGPYTSKNNEDLSWDLKIAHSSANEHPGPESDGFNDILWADTRYKWKNLLFGFLSEGEAYEWFFDFWQQLLDNGFKVVQYDAEMYWIGRSGKQVLFHKEAK